ncbi:MAG: tetratricopeptide repeat protein [Planctomycetota bacterium]|nr:tetratricopeptide repeat protein [Planctomycetota bacterium]
MPTLRAFALALTLLGVAWVSAEDAVQQKASKLEREIHQAFAQKDYQAAMEKCQVLVELAPENSGALYNLACAQARLGKTDEALASLGTSVEKGYGDPAHMKEDEDLASLRADKRFEDLAAKARENERKGGWEKAGEIEGVKTVEDFPEGGLRFRLRMNPEATKEKPNRLVIWLHPSGGSMNNTVEAMSKFFVKRGYALLVLTKKQWMGWTGPEMEQLMKRTLPAVGKIEGIDARKPILMGFSAGGQAALNVWGDDPSGLGGLVVDAAYPLDMESYARGQVKVMALPNAEAIKQVPIYVLVGDQDGGHQLWKKCEDDWRKAGIPLSIDYVAGGRHQWLVGKPQAEALAKWLEEVAAGKLPGQAEAKPAEAKTTADVPGSEAVK